MDRRSHAYVRKPTSLKPSACTPLFLAAFEKGAGCCIHTHSQWAVLVTLLVEKAAEQSGKSIMNTCFEIEQIEQIKGIPKGKNKPGMLGYFDRLRVPIIENTAQYDVGSADLGMMKADTTQRRRSDSEFGRGNGKLSRYVRSTSTKARGVSELGFSTHILVVQY